MSEFLTIQSYEFRTEAEIAQARLAADGIQSAVRADDEGGLNPGFYRDYSVRLEVRPDDLQDALESLGIDRVELPVPLALAIRNHALWAYPDEACGLVLADPAGIPAFVVCLTNGANSAKQFTIEPSEHHGTIKLAESMDMTVLGAFHSHPRSPALPSETDLDGGSDPEWLQIIIGPVVGRDPELRGFRYRDGGFDEVWVDVLS